MGLAGGTVNAGFGYSAQRLQLGTLSYNVNGTNTIFSLSYGYTQNGGNNGQITSITDNVQAGRSGTYTFDALNRLTNYQTVGSAGYPQQTMSWSYDRYGNRLTQALNGNVQTLSPSSTTNRLTGYAYDANGNLTNDGSNGLTWDAENRMVNYGTGTGSIGNEYDGNSLRVRRTKQGGSDVAYVFAGAQPIAEYAAGTAANNPSVEYVYLGGQLIGSKSSGTYSFYERDHLSIRGVLSDSNPGSPSEQGHLPFGEIWYGSGIKWRFTSYERDSDVGDDFATFRRYQYTFGRFNSPDPVMGVVENPQRWNRYTYALNDPIDLIDPLGLNEHACYWGPGADEGWDDTPENGGATESQCAEQGGSWEEISGPPPMTVDVTGTPDGGQTVVFIVQVPAQIPENTSAAGVSEKKGLLNCTIRISNKITISNGLAHIPGVGKYLQEGSWGRTTVDILGGGNAVTGILDAGRTMFGNSANGTQLAQTAVGIVADPSMGLNPGLKLAGGEGIPSALEALQNGSKALEGSSGLFEAATEGAAEGATGIGLLKLGADALLTAGSAFYCGVIY